MMTFKLSEGMGLFGTMDLQAKDSNTDLVLGKMSEN